MNGRTHAAERGDGDATGSVDAPDALRDRPPANRDTPAMRQFARFKREHPGCILFFRLGDFYEMFDEDARTAHRILGITLTERAAGIPMAGVPFHSAEGYLKRLVEAGERVAVCEQMQDPKEAKGIVERAVVRVVTPGTRVDDALLSAGSCNAVAAVAIGGAAPARRAAIALIELSTGSFTVTACDEADVLDELARQAPSEVVFAEEAALATGERLDAVARAIRAAPTARPAWSMGVEEASAALCRHFRVASPSSWGLSGECIAAAGGLLGYLVETQSGVALDGASGASVGTRSLAHIAAPRLADRSTSVILDAWTMRALEVERTSLDGGTQGSLLAALDRTRTPMGRRLLREWLCFPLRDRRVIEARHDVVGALVQESSLRSSLVTALARIQDIARIRGRVAMRRATPRDLVALGRSLGSAPALLELLEGTPPLAALAQRIAALAPRLAPLGTRIVGACVDDPPAHLREGGLFRDGADGELDEARSLQRDAGEWLARYQAALIAQTGIDSLRTGYNRVFGYYIEVTHAHTQRVPPTFARRQTLRNAERYITPELKSFEDKVLTAERRALDRERALFEQLLESVASEAEPMAAFADAIAELDALASFAEVAARQNYARPEIAEAPCLQIVDGRHPVLDQSLGSKFVANDCTLDPTRATLALITGPNMAGKSTYIRQNALIALMALAGSFVPAASARIGLCDRIFARIGASDELHAGRSTFMVEMTETASILHHATARTLIVLDEIGRGTSTLDGLSLAWAISEALAAVKARTLFATHYHELTALADDDASIVNLQVTVREWKDELLFLHRIEPGRADRSYGLHVAKLAGVPRSVVDRARAVLETLAVHSTASCMSSPSATAAASCSRQPTLFDSPASNPTHDRVCDELASIDLNQLTPLQAFDRLRALRELLSSANNRT